MKGTHEHSG